MLDLREELLRLEADDDRTRERLARDGSLFQGYHPEMEAVHRRNATRLGAIIAEYGWPRLADVGADAVRAAWRIVQHAIGEPAFMRACLPLLQDAAARGELDRAQLTMLVDRIRTLEGRPQLYGTQYDWDEGCRWMVPIGEIEDVATVDARRRDVGLPPIEWRKAPHETERQPNDPAARRAEMLAWAKRVGWRS